METLLTILGLRDPSVAFKICQTGLAKLSIVDDGYYGTGECSHYSLI